MEKPVGGELLAYNAIHHCDFYLTTLIWIREGVT